MIHCVLHDPGDSVAVVVVEVEVPGEAEQCRRLRRLLHAQCCERVGIGGRIAAAFVTPSGDEHPHLRAGRRPLRERAARGDLRVVGMGVDRERARGDLGAGGHATSVPA